jgi:tetratricopeptide (TPR) repeat protein
MKSVGRSAAIVAFGAFFSLLFLFTQSASAQNTIAGTVYDKSAAPLADIDVELLDEYYRMRSRMKTSSTGKYEFGGLNDGRWYVRVYAFRYDLIDETHEVYASSVSAIPGRQGVSYNLEDFYLMPKKGGLRDAELGVVFAQEVPKEAEQAYKKALDDLGKKRADEGFAGLQKAIEIYPKYYNALVRFGYELFLRQQYLPSAQAYLSAADVNPHSAIAFYYSAYALYMLGPDYYKSATTAATESVKLAPASVAVNLLLGSLERKTGKFEAAEKHLQQAKKLSPNKSPEIFKELAQLYSDEKKYKEAADELEQYIKASKMSEEDEAKAKKVVENLRAKANGPSIN